MSAVWAPVMIALISLAGSIVVPIVQALIAHYSLRDQVADLVSALDDGRDHSYILDQVRKRLGGDDR